MKNWLIENDLVKTGVTEIGGFLDPLVFKINGKEISPFNRAPWISENTLDESIPPMLRMLRNDFFCAPFGDSDLLENENRAHGVTANDCWKEIEIKKNKISLELEKNILNARIRKNISVEENHPIVYEEHIFEGGEGEIPVGHHLMLKAENEIELNFSKFVFGGTPPSPVETDDSKGRSLLKYPQEFNSLQNVELSNGEKADLTIYPALRQHEDLLMLISDESLPFAWSTAVCKKEGWLFFALKNPKILRNTVLWFSNGGRYFPPFSGRHKNVIGIEEVTSFFHLGHKASTENNFLRERGFPTSIKLNKDKNVSLRYLFGIVPISKEFGRVKNIEAFENGINIIDESNNKIFTKVNLNFITEVKEGV